MQTESTKTGIVILALLALATMLGGLAGWSLRPLSPIVEIGATSSPPESVKSGGD